MDLQIYAALLMNLHANIADHVEVIILTVSAENWTRETGALSISKEISALEIFPNLGTNLTFAAETRNNANSAAETAPESISKLEKLRERVIGEIGWLMMKHRAHQKTMGRKTPNSTQTLVYVA